MYKITLCLLMASLFSGCGIDYEGSTKYIFKGQITDRNGQPIPDIEVATFVDNGHASDIIGYDRTDGNGNYLMIFPKARNVETSLYINHEFYGSNTNSNYSGMEVVGIEQESIENYTINFSITKLFRNDDAVNLRINLVSISNRSIIKIRPLGLVQYSEIEYDPDFFGTVDNEDQYFDPDNRLYYVVAKNQDLVIKYVLQDNTVHDVHVPVGAEDLTYNLEY